MKQLISLKKVNVVFISFILFFGTNVFSQNQINLNTLGLFKYEEPKGYEDSYIRRTRRKQVEYKDDKSEKIVFGIEWISKNEYWLTVKKKKNTFGCLAKGSVIKVKIVNSSENGFEFDADSELCGSMRVIFVRI